MIFIRDNKNGSLGKDSRKYIYIEFHLERFARILKRIRNNGMRLNRLVISVTFSRPSYEVI